MTKLSPMPQVQLPVAGPPAVARPPQTADPEKVAKAARDFEAMAIGQLLQPMFDTVDSAHDAFGGGPGEEAWKPMLVQDSPSRSRPMAAWAWPSRSMTRCCACRRPPRNE